MPTSEKSLPQSKVTKPNGPVSSQAFGVNKSTEPTRPQAPPPPTVSPTKSSWAALQNLVSEQNALHDEQIASCVATQNEILNRLDRLEAVQDTQQEILTRLDRLEAVQDTQQEILGRLERAVKELQDDHRNQSAVSANNFRAIGKIMEAMKEFISTLYADVSQMEERVHSMQVSQSCL